MMCLLGILKCVLGPGIMSDLGCKIEDALRLQNSKMKQVPKFKGCIVYETGMTIFVLSPLKAYSLISEESALKNIFLTYFYFKEDDRPFQL